MTYFYEIGAMRWKRFDSDSDVRYYRPNKGWRATAQMLDYHPTTDRHLPAAQWWICETYYGDGA